MADSKIDFSFENLHFSCEGENTWVERQLNNVLSRIPALLSVHRKTENIVEEVIDVEEEDVKVVKTKSPRTDKRVAKGSKGKVVKKAKEKIAKVKIAKEPKVKVAEQIDSPLSKYLNDKKVGNNQVRKFLATATFLARNNNLSRLSTPMISRALKSYGIEKLQNASDCLNKNEKKGYCIKEGKDFIITENGYLSIE